MEIPGNVVAYPLRLLEAQGAKHLLESLCERFSVALEPDLSLAIVSQLDYHPFYIRSLVEGARREEMQLQTPREFAEVYAMELTRGNLHLFFGSLLHSANFSVTERMKALEVLHTCSRGTLDLSALHFFQEENGRIGPDPERILEALRQATLLEQGIGTITPITDTILRDWIEWNFKHSLRGVPMTEVSYQITANLLKRFQGNVQATIQADRMKQVERLMGLMDCQSIPTVLMDFSQFSPLEQLQDPQELSKRLHESEQMPLPEMLSVTREETIDDTKVGFSGPVSVGRGFEERRYNDERETAWLVSYCPNELVGLNEIQQFHDKCLRTARENRYKRIRIWLLTENRFNQAALSFAREHGIMTSKWSQFKLLLNRLAPTSQNSEQAMARDLATFEMVIPVTEDSELVPVRALEQIAENFNFEEKAKGQIRMAVMEACINAKEYALSPGGRIHLRFRGKAEALLINLRVDSLAPKDKPRVKPTGDVWNLKLLRSLMDDARISYGPSGLELSMTKYLSKTLTQVG